MWLALLIHFRSYTLNLNSECQHTPFETAFEVQLLVPHHTVEAVQLPEPHHTFKRHILIRSDHDSTFEMQKKPLILNAHQYKKDLRRPAWSDPRVANPVERRRTFTIVEIDSKVCDIVT